MQYYSNITVPTSKVYVDTDLNFGAYYTVESSKILTTDDAMINKYYIKIGGFEFVCSIIYNLRILPKVDPIRAIFGSPEILWPFFVYFTRHIEMLI